MPPTTLRIASTACALEDLIVSQSHNAGPLVKHPRSNDTSYDLGGETFITFQAAEKVNGERGDKTDDRGDERPERQRAMSGSRLTKRGVGNVLVQTQGAHRADLVQQEHHHRESACQNGDHQQTHLHLKQNFVQLGASYFFLNSRVETDQYLEHHGRADGVVLHASDSNALT